MAQPSDGYFCMTWLRASLRSQTRIHPTKKKFSAAHSQQSVVTLPSDFNSLTKARFLEITFPPKEKARLDETS
jgi:hypothetical protein